MTVQWEEPPEADLSAKRDRYRAITDELVANPARWAVVTDFTAAHPAHSLATRIRAGYGAFGRGVFEARTARIDAPDGQEVWRVYSRCTVPRPRAN